MALSASNKNRSKFIEAEMGVGHGSPHLLVLRIQRYPFLGKNQGFFKGGLQDRELQRVIQGIKVCQHGPGQAAFRLPSNGLFQNAEGLLEGFGSQDVDMMVETEDGFIGFQRFRGLLPGLVGQQNLTVTVPPGLPSSLLERRPDILSAEQQLAAANARVGEAKALLFPNIKITGVAGWESAALKSLFTGPASFWDIVSPGITQPIFTAGRLRANVRATEAQKQEALLAYKKSIQQAFQDVSDSLVAVQRLREVRIEAERQVKALSQQTELAYQRYFGGVTPYLEVLDSDRQLFESQLRLTQAQANELLAVIALYRALGGGWQTE
jgi:hypothetical protein